MKIIILGAGRVGTTLLEHLMSEHSDLTIVDNDPQKLELLSERFDLRTVLGEGSHPDVLRDAGAMDADLLVAVTASDETNMLACHIAHTIFHTPKKIARLRSSAYTDHPELFNYKAIAIDVLISPEQVVTEYIEKLIYYPGSLQVLDFAKGRVQLVGLRVYPNTPLGGETLKNLRSKMSHVGARIVAVFRKNESIMFRKKEAAIPTEETIIEAYDEIFFIAAKEHVRNAISAMRGMDQPYQNITIAGGGNIGFRLAQRLESQYNVKIIEHSEARVHELAGNLHHALVLQGSAADEALLFNEGIDETDVFCAVTNDEETNIMASLLAKRMGARKVMSLVNRQSYVDLIEESPIDIAISPQQATTSQLLRHVRRGDIAQAHSLRRGAAEALEVVAHGTAQKSKVIGRTLADIKLPRGATIDAIVRENEVILAEPSVVIQSEDHIILFLENKKSMAEVEKMFQVDISFF